MIVWALLCSSSAIDRDSNNISLFDVLEQLNMPEAADGQVIPIRFDFISLWQRDDPDVPERYDVALRIIDPQGDLMSESTYPVDLQEFDRLRLRTQNVGLPIRGQGRYIFELRRLDDDRVMSQTPLTIIYSDES